MKRKLAVPALAAAIVAIAGGAAGLLDVRRHALRHFGLEVDAGRGSERLGPASRYRPWDSGIQGSPCGQEVTCELRMRREGEPGRRQSGYSSFRQARGSSGCPFGVRSSRKE